MKAMTLRSALWAGGLISAVFAVLSASFLASADAAPNRAVNAELAALPGHIHRFASARFDAGEAPNSLRMHGLEIVFAKTPAQSQALTQLLADQENPKSPLYHHWLTPAQYGARFGASDAQMAAILSWLKSNGFEVGNVPAGRAHLPFSGTKEQAESALHTSIHLFNVNGEQHFANVSEPMVPAALKPFIASIRGLNDFRPKPGVKQFNAPPRSLLPALVGAPARANASPDTYYSGSNQFPGYVGPTDFATIYDLLPAYQQGITGAGVTVGIAAQSDISASVLTTFWTAFGVAGSHFGLPAQQFTSMAVPGSDGGLDPGQSMDGNEDEAYLDTEILGALAPGAKLVLVRDHSATTAAQYIIDQNLAGILNVSFGTCEADEGAGNTAVNSMWQQAVSEGITVTVSSADAGVASCIAQSDQGNTNDVNSNGFGVNGLASTPYNLAVGGTDFDPTSESTYWNTFNQSGTRENAISHIPEMVWNDSCANPVLAQAYSSDPLSFCNSANLPGITPATANPYIEISGAGGGLSSCTTTGNSGNCTGGYPQPSWQQGVAGITNFGTRALPDVSMIATRWLTCSYDTNPCDPSQPPTFTRSGTILVLDGTSAAAPSVAAILALVDQTQITSALPDGRQGLVNTTLYSLAATEYGSAANVTACNASQGAIAVTACIFYDVTAGSDAQPCEVSNYAANSVHSLPASTCGHNSGQATGIMEISGTQDYAAGSGFDIATGLGSIDAANLIAAYKGLSAPSGLTASASGQTVTLKWTASASATMGYDIYQGDAPGPVSLTPIQQNVSGTTTTVTGLQLGQSYVFAVAAVTSTGVAAFSGETKVTLVPPVPTLVGTNPAGAGSLTLFWQPSTGASSYEVFQATTMGAEGAKPVRTGVTGTSTTFSQLTPGQTYFFTVVALDAGGGSSPSAEASGMVVPAAPTGLTATAGNGSVSLAWSASSGAATYNVYEGTSSGAESGQPLKEGITGTSTTITGLTNGTTYYFTVAAVDTGGTSAASNQASAKPAAPSGGGGGGSMDALALALLAFAAFLRHLNSSAAVSKNV